MRFSILFAVGLATDVAMASVCKPRPSASSSVVSLESVTSTISATVQAETTTATSADLSTTLTSGIDDETTETATTTETSVTSGFSTTIETTGTTETATTDVTTSAQATTTEATSSAETTTADATSATANTFVPIPTFSVLAIGAQVDGQKLSGQVTAGSNMGWNLEGAAPNLIFSIDSDTNKVRERNGKYLCLQYTERDIHFLKLCDPSTETNFIGGIAIVTCEQTRDRRLECSAPAGQCIEDPVTSFAICSALPRTFTGFSTYSGMTMGVGLVMGWEGNGPTADSQSVDLRIEPAVIYD